MNVFSVSITVIETFLCFKDKLKNKKEEHTKFGIYYDDDYDYLQHLREVRNTVVHWEQAPEKPVKVSVEILTRENLILENFFYKISLL